MIPIRSLAAVLLILTGLLHLAYAIRAPLVTDSIVTAAFGVAYLLIGLLLFRGGKQVLWLGALVPLIGLVVATIGMLIKPTALGVIFLLIDIAVVTICFLLLFRKEEYRSSH